MFPAESCSIFSGNESIGACGNSHAGLVSKVKMPGGKHSKAIIVLLLLRAFGHVERESESRCAVSI